MSIKVTDCRYGVEMSSEVRPTLDDEERTHYQNVLLNEMAQTFAHYIMTQKRDAVQATHPMPYTETYKLELYVMTPQEFHLAVRQEAKEYLRFTQQYPLYRVKP